MLARLVQFRTWRGIVRLGQVMAGKPRLLEVNTVYFRLGPVRSV
jgi:hypothetical protein